MNTLFFALAVATTPPPVYVVAQPAPMVVVQQAPQLVYVQPAPRVVVQAAPVLIARPQHVHGKKASAPRHGHHGGRR